MRKFSKLTPRLDPEVQTLLRQYLESLNRFRLGDEADHGVRTVEVGILGETETVEPYIAFVHNKEFQIAQLYSIHKGNEKDNKED